MDPSKKQIIRLPERIKRKTTLEHTSFYLNEIRPSHFPDMNEVSVKIGKRKATLLIDEGVLSSQETKKSDHTEIEVVSDSGWARDMSIPDEFEKIRITISHYGSPKREVFPAYLSSSELSNLFC